MRRQNSTEKLMLNTHLDFVHAYLSEYSIFVQYIFCRLTQILKHKISGLHAAGPGKYC